MTAAREAQYLFGTVPADLFKVLAGRSRYFFADLLAHLADDLFGHAGEIATRRRVHEAIAEFIDRNGLAVVAAELVLEEGVSGPSGPTYVTANNIRCSILVACRRSGPLSQAGVLIFGPPLAADAPRHSQRERFAPMAARS